MHPHPRVIVDVPNQVDSVQTVITGTVASVPVRCRDHHGRLVTAFPLHPAPGTPAVPDPIDVYLRGTATMLRLRDQISITVPKPVLSIAATAADNEYGLALMVGACRMGVLQSQRADGDLHRQCRPADDR